MEFRCGRYDQEVGENSPFKISAPTLRADGTCSYCGSIEEKEFFACIETGATITPTDKSYKVYVDAIGRDHAKFYFQHLSEEGKDRFVSLLNAQVLKLATPGYFYVLPYFVRKA